MLGIVLLYVGIVLISNGCYGLLGIEDKSNVVMNLFTGGLGLVLNIIAIGIGVARGADVSWYYASGTGLLFAFTYLYTALNTIFDFDKRLYGIYSLFVAINTIPAGLLCITQGYGGNWIYGLIWWAWGILWLTAFIEINLKKPLGKFVGVPGRCRGNCHGLDSRFPHARGHVAGVASPCSGAGGRPALVSRLALPERLGRVQSKGRKRERPCNCPSVSRKR
ncbi:MAG: AmiS/UreI family transporter [Olsenella sp.]|nr:AmiS/UreI family transporter [Olsenella sp.]